MTNEYERKEKPSEIDGLLKTLIEIQVSQNNELMHLKRQMDTVICVLDRISMQTCAMLNEDNTQTALQTAMKTASETFHTRAGPFPSSLAIHTNISCTFAQSQGLRLPGKEPDQVPDENIESH